MMRKVLIAAVIAIVVAGLAAFYLLPLWMGGHLNPRWRQHLIDESLRNGEVIVACLYQYHDRHGNFPSKLDDLVPECLPRIPNPAAGNRRWRYTGSPDEFELYFADDKATLPDYHYDSRNPGWHESSK